MELLCRAPEIEITNQGDWEGAWEVTNVKLCCTLFGVCAGKMTAVTWRFLPDAGCS